MTKAALVLIPIHGSCEYLNKCLESLVQDSQRICDVLVVNDRANRDVLDLVETYVRAGGDSWKLITSSGDGLPNALNSGINYAFINGYKFVFRLDADDIVINNRFTTQLRYMENHPDVDIVGSYSRLIDSKGSNLGIQRRPSSAQAIASYAFYASPLIHPSICIRLERFNRNTLLFKSTFPSAQDYDLFTRLIAQGYRLENIRSPLIKYRVHESSDSHINKISQLIDSLRIGKHYLSHFTHAATESRQRKSIMIAHELLFISYARAAAPVGVTHTKEPIRLIVRVRRSFVFWAMQMVIMSAIPCDRTSSILRQANRHLLLSFFLRICRQDVSELFALLRGSKECFSLISSINEDFAKEHSKYLLGNRCIVVELF